MFVLLFSAAMAYLPTCCRKYMAILVDLAGYITAPRGVAAIIGVMLTQSISVKKLWVRKTISLGIVILLKCLV